MCEQPNCCGQCENSNDQKKCSEYETHARGNESLRDKMDGPIQEPQLNGSKSNESMIRGMS